MANSNFDVCHAWAHNEDRAHNGSSISHRDGILYSYSTCIGQRIEMNGKVIFIIDDNYYSASTNRHQCYMWQSIPFNETEVFKFPVFGYNRNCFISRYNLENKCYDELITCGLTMLLQEYENCSKISTPNTLRNDFSYHGYNEMVRLFEVTGVTTVSKLLRTKQSVFDSYVYLPKGQRAGFRKMFHMMSKGEPVEAIVDAINGKGCCDAYIKRTERFRVAEKNRRLSDFCGFASSRRNLLETYAGTCNPCIIGSITKKNYEKHVKDRDLVPWMMKLRRNNFQRAAEVLLENERVSRHNLAMRRLETYIGMRGFVSHWARASFHTFDYNGTIIDFRGRYHYKERQLTEDEYQDYVASSDKKEWIKNKRQWTLEQLQADQREYEEKAARLEEWQRQNRLEEERKKKMLEEKHDYIEAQKSRGSDGYRQLYHEGIYVTLPRDSELYYGGNVLLRFNEIRNQIETSKGISLSIDEGKRLWSIFNRWHKHKDECQKGLLIQTVYSQYRVHSFKNEILTAGCHEIAYREMAYIADLLHFEQ